MSSSVKITRQTDPLDLIALAALIPGAPALSAMTDATGTTVRAEHEAVTVAQLQDALARYVPPTLPPDPDVAFRAAIEGATTLAALKAAILGSTGPGAQPRVR